MQPTMEVLAKLNQNSQKHSNEVFTRLYRYLLREDIYYVAYKNLYANSGAGTKGIDNDTADGFSEQYVKNIIKKLSNGNYRPKPVRRVYIEKSNGKRRPLGLPTFTDKLVQEVLRMILEAVYEPIFLDCSYGFRPNKGCHMALTKIKREFNGTMWFIEGDIKGCFDNINHNRLIEIISNKIRDERFLQLIRKFLSSGYMEDWQYNKTYSGCPQGGIISPILSNIYLPELDTFVQNLKVEFDKPATRKFTPEYDKISSRVKVLVRRMKKAKTTEERNKLVDEWRIARKQLLKTPSKSQTDKKLKYVRYADDFLIGVNGSKEDCENLKAKLHDFIGKNLKMEMSDEKTYITHSNTPARFLGYDIKIRRNSQTKPGTHGRTQRTMSYTTELTVPFERIEKFLFNKKAVFMKNGKMFPCKRTTLVNLTDLEILNSFNSEIRGICNYYTLAANYGKLNYFSYLMEYSCLKTIAAKHGSTIRKILNKYKDGQGGWAIPYETKGKIQKMSISSYKTCSGNKIIKDDIVNATLYHQHSTTSFESRLKAKQCELCGTTKSDCYEVHHVNKVKNLQGKTIWEQIMIAKNRKTLVVCKECHIKIHNN